MDFSALHVALTGLQAAQLGMETASHNIANASNPAYTREGVELRSRFPRRSTYGQVGLGVEVTDITRARDRFLDARVRLGSSTAASLDIRSRLLSRAEDVFADPGSGLSSQLSAVWNAFEDLGLNPPDMAARREVLDALDALASGVRSVASAWSGLAGDATSSMGVTIDEVNDMLAQVGELNRRISESTAQPGTPNDLLDQRDVLLDGLAKKIGASVIDTGQGQVRVSLNGMALVDGTTVNPLTFDAATATVRHSSGVEVAVGGEIRGFQTFLQDDLPTVRGGLDAFATSLADALNTAHASGYWSETDQGGDLLSYDPTRPAASLDLALTDPMKLATAGDPGPPFPVYDGRNADALASLRTTPVGGRTLEESLRGVIVDLGQAASAADAASDAQSAMQASYETSRAGAHGVSLDEEMVSMMQYQRAYEAAARSMTAVDEALDVLINRTGLVGR